MITKFFGLIMTFACIPIARLSGDESLVLLAGGDDETVGVAAKEAKLFEPFAAEYDDNGELWIIEMAQGNRLLRVNRQGKLEHVAGAMGGRDEKKGETFQDGAALDALFHGPHNLAIREAGEVWISDTWNGKIRVWKGITGEVRSLEHYGTDKGLARAQGPYCITFSPDKRTLHIANLRQVLAYDLQKGSVSVVAGNGEKGIPADGTRAVDAPLVDPRAAAADQEGNIYILERNGNALRVVRPSGMIETLVNRSGKAGDGLKEGAALDVKLNGPKHLCLDIDGGVIIADAENHVIRKYDPKTRTIQCLVGNGKKGRGELGTPPRSFMLARPHGVSVDRATGHLVITDSYNNRVLMLKRGVPSR